MKGLMNRLQTAIDIEYQAIIEILKDQNNQLEMELVGAYDSKRFEAAQFSSVEFMADYTFDLKLILHVMISEFELTLMNVQCLQLEALKKNVDWIFQAFLRMIEKYLDAPYLTGRTTY